MKTLSQKPGSRLSPTRAFALSARKNTKRDKITSIIVIVVFFLDRLTKYLAAKNLLLNQPILLIKGILSLTLIHNRGAAFGILNNRVPFFIFTSACAILFIYFNLKNHKYKKPYYRISMSLILAGALGNLADRLFLGYVVDFIDFHIWPVFNISDSAITIGAALLAYSILFSKAK